eukprot:364570-Chlamydomonas_euryale.AAC.17
MLPALISCKASCHSRTAITSVHALCHRHEGSHSCGPSKCHPTCFSRQARSTAGPCNTARLHCLTS